METHNTVGNTMITSVVFDFDDTLVMTFESKSQAMQVFGKKFYNQDIPLEKIRQYWGLPFRQFLQEIYGKFDTIESIVEKYMVIREDFPARAYPHAREIINRLSSSYELGIVSASEKDAITNDFRLLGFETERFCYIQTAEDTQVHKPNPRVFEPILSVLARKNIFPQNVLYVGDSLSDYFAARDAGLSFFGLHDRTTPKAEFIKHGAQSVASLSDLPGLL